MLSLSLFGTFGASVDGAPVTGFRTDKARALLAYLAVESDRPHLRTSLAALLWPDMPDEIALRNLRKTLHRLQEALPEPTGLALESVLQATRHAIALNGEACSVDVRSFQELLEAGASHPHRALHLCRQCLERLSRAVDLYRGELLAGFGLPDAEPFEEWLLLKREALLHQALRSLFDLAEASVEREEYERAYAYASRQVELDPGREEAHRQVMGALMLMGQRSEALAYFERCRQMLLETFGVEPAADTVALVEQIAGRTPSGAGEAARLESATRRSTQLASLPAQLTPFIGRDAELEQIAEYLRDPDYRLVTIVGPGGVGKTRLAIRAAERSVRSGRFADGVAFMALAHVNSAESLPAAILAGLGLDPDDRTDALTQITHYLAPRKCLLVLDNLEQILDGTDVLLALLTAARDVCLLVTSRLPLGLHAEQRVILEGLDYPDVEEPDARHGDGAYSRSGEAPASGHRDGVALSGSVELFLQTARRVDPSFVLSESNRQDVVRICRLVEGMPLALELAAPWVRAMDCAAIATAIEQSLVLLQTAARDIPDRHRSMEAVLTQSWRLLKPGEQSGLTQLAAFTGPFDADAAAGIAGVSLLDLAGFVDKCLVQRTGSGLYRLHELLRQFAGGMPPVDPAVGAESVRRRHGEYYLRRVADHERALYGQEPRLAVGVLQQQMGNLRQAWTWAAERPSEALAAGLEGLGRFWDLTNQFDEAAEMLENAASRLGPNPGGDSLSRTEPASFPGADLLVRVLVWQAHFEETRNRVDDALQTAERARDLAAQRGDLDGEAVARSVLGEVLPHRGEFAGAVTNLEAACEYFERQAHARHLSRAQSRLGIAHWRVGAYVQAADHLMRACDLLHSLGDNWELARTSSALAGVAFEQGDMQRAQTSALEALRLYERCEDRRGVASMRGNLALVYRNMGHYDLALEHNQYDLEASRHLGDLHDTATALGNRGMIHLESGDEDGALQCLEEAVQIEEGLGNLWDAARHRAGVALVRHRRGEQDIAVAHFERALPVLRSHGAPYYTIKPLLDAAELYLAMGRLEEAAGLTQEAADAARELGLDDAASQAETLANTIAAAPAEGHPAGAV